MENLLVGGAGFIGSTLVRELGPENTVVFDNFSPIVHTAESVRVFTQLGTDFVVGDVTDRGCVADFLGERGAPRTLVYLAAETGTGRSLENCTLNARVNTLGLATLLDAFSSLNAMPERIVLTSTRAVYGEGPYEAQGGKVVYPRSRALSELESGSFEFDGLKPLAMDAELHFPKPMNVYGATKLSQENLLQSWAAAFDIPLYIFRLQNVYGAGQSLSNPYTGVLIHFIKQCIAGEPIQIFENGGITRDFVHVEDVAALLARAANGRGRPGTYDCGSGERIELEDVAAKLAQLDNAPPLERTNQYRRGDVRHAAASITRTIDEFGWRPKVSLDAGLSTLSRFVHSRVG